MLPIMKSIPLIELSRGEELVPGGVINIDVDIPDGHELAAHVLEEGDCCPNGIAPLGYEGLFPRLPD